MMILARRGLPALLFLLLYACSSGPELPRLANDAVILAFGDSLTHGTGAAPDESYPAVLMELTGRQVINAGVPGEVSAEGARRLPSLLDRHRPDLLILCHGGNDLLRKLGRDRLAANLRSMVEAARSRDIPVVLIGVPEPTVFMMSSAKVYGTLADELELPFEAKLLPAIESDSALKSDPIHPNAAGYRKLAEGIAAFLQETGAI